MKYYIIAAEPSGDLHGANLMKAILKIDRDAQFNYWGGDKMKNVAPGLVQHYERISFMGFVEVAKNITTILSLFSKAKNSIKFYNPDVVIFIDYPGFNLRMAKWTKAKGYKNIYYITPQVWAWKKNRAFDLKKYCDRIITILPFEKKFFKDLNIDVDYVGHPLLDEIEYSINNEREDVVALLPGSRQQEVKHLLHPMLIALKDENSELIIAKAPHIPKTFYKQIINEIPDLKTVPILQEFNTYGLLKKARYALTASGTATLECAILHCPQVVLYKGNKISYHIAKRIIDLEYISLVNLIIKKPLVDELIQADVTPLNINASIERLLESETEILAGYNEIINLLGKKGASIKAANIIFSELSS